MDNETLKKVAGDLEKLLTAYGIEYERTTLKIIITENYFNAVEANFPDRPVKWIIDLHENNASLYLNFPPEKIGLKDIDDVKRTLSAADKKENF